MTKNHILCLDFWPLLENVTQKLITAMSYNSIVHAYLYTGESDITFRFSTLPSAWANKTAPEVVDI